MRFKSHIHARFNKFYPLGQDKGAAIVNINVIDFKKYVKPELYTNSKNRVKSLYGRRQIRVQIHIKTGVGTSRIRTMGYVQKTGIRDI